MDDQNLYTKILKASNVIKNNENSAFEEQELELNNKTVKSERNPIYYLYIFSSVVKTFKKLLKLIISLLADFFWEEFFKYRLPQCIGE